MKDMALGGLLRQWLSSVRSSLWFVPTLVILATSMLALGLVELDRHIDDLLRLKWPRTFTTEPDGARSMLGAIAGSMATVAGVVFSITVVALALASNQYTPRVLRNFMRDRSNQIVLGLFVAVYIYCLLVLRTINGDDRTFVPSAAVLGAVVLAVLASGALIFFIHHISSSIQASGMAASIARETIAAIESLFPDAPGKKAVRQPPQAAPSGRHWYPVPAQRMGYVQSITGDGLLGFARKHDTIVRMECRRAICTHSTDMTGICSA